MVFHWNLSDNKSPQVSRTLLSIMDYFNNTVVWMVSICLLISMFSSPYTNPLGINPKAPTTIGITVSFKVHTFLSPLEGSR